MTSRPEKVHVIGAKEAPTRTTLFVVMVLSLLALVVAFCLWFLAPDAHASGDQFGMLQCANWRGCTARSVTTGYRLRWGPFMRYGDRMVDQPPARLLRHALRRDQVLVKSLESGAWYDLADFAIVTK